VTEVRIVAHRVGRKRSNREGEGQVSKYSHQYYSASKQRFYMIEEMAGPHLRNAYKQLAALTDEMSPNWEFRDSLMNAMRAEMAYLGMDVSNLDEKEPTP
jgi:hypothetical protein